MNLSAELQTCLEVSEKFIVKHHLEYLTTEVLLFVLTEMKTPAEVLKKSGCDVSKLSLELYSYIAVTVPQIEDDSIKPIKTSGYNEALKNAVAMAMTSGRECTDVLDLLVSLYEMEQNDCSIFMKSNGVQKINLLTAVSNRRDKVGIKPKGENPESILNKFCKLFAFDDTHDDNDNKVPKSLMLPGFDENSESDDCFQFGDSNEDDEDEEFGPSYKGRMLATFTRNLTEEARAHLLDPLIGREAEVDQTIQVLCRRTKNNPLHVGDAGVGKTAITEGLAQRIVSGDVPASLKDSQIYSLDLGGLVAGTKFRGEFENRIRLLIEELKNKPNSILFIDEIHMLMGAGSGNTSSIDAANLLKPLFTKGDVRCIGATTFEEYKKTILNDSALCRRFQKIDITEPTEDETFLILKGLQKRYEDYHGVTYTDEALKEAISLSVKYLTDRRLPDKVIDVIDEAGSFLKIKSEKENSNKKTVTEEIIQKVIAKMARVPEKKVSSTEIDKLKDLESQIKQSIFAQDFAVEKVCSAVKKSRAGFGNQEKPIANFLFVGPTGVGKTELARMLAKNLEANLIRIDMSEYQEKHTVSRMIGSPPGYVGFEEGGLLTDAVRKNPTSVILFDEIEKAHPDVFNLLLQVMDYGFLTDNQGRKADFRNCILIMTSNAGASQIGKNFIGFGERSQDESAINEAVERTFTPEFRNRLDAIIPFNHLQKSDINLITKKELAILEIQLNAKGIDFQIDDNAVDFISDAGYSKEFGARNIARTVEKYVTSVLVDEVLFGKVSKGGTIHCSLEESENQLKFDYS